MAFKLSRDQALTVPLLSTYGTATLLSKEGQEVKVALAPLLGASSLVRSIVASSQLHPGVHGPLILSLEVAAHILECVVEILGAGESDLMGRNIEEVKHALDILGVEANLSRSSKNIENYEQQVALREENIKLEIVFESIDYEDADLSDVNANEAKDNSSEQSDVNVKKLGESPDPKFHADKNAAKEKVEKCNICEYSAISLSDLKVHKKSHTVFNRSDFEKPNRNKTRVVEPYTTCHICNKSFAHSSSLHRHSIIHTGEKPYSCQVCASSFNRQGTLRRHLRIHTGEKPHSCQICDKSFSQLSHLRSHCKTHTGEKPFKCKVCGYTTVNGGTLNRHKMIHTGERPHKCKICNYSCIRSSHLKDHMTKHTGEKAFKCQVCDYSATTRSKIRKHEKKEHDL